MVTKEKAIDFIVLSLRWYLIYYMFTYGWAKLTLSQFGVYDDAILATPMQEVDVFYLAWHLHGKSVFFNYTTGIIEIIGALLLIYNRTALLGTLLTLITLGQILIFDIAFTTNMHGAALVVRVSGMILAGLAILYYYRDRVKAAFHRLTDGVTTRLKYKWWIYLILPVVGFLLDFVFAILTLPIRMLLHSLM